MRVAATIMGDYYLMAQFVFMCVLFEVWHGKSANACSRRHTDDLLVDVLAGNRHIGIYRPFWFWLVLVPRPSRYMYPEFEYLYTLPQKSPTC